MKAWVVQEQGNQWKMARSELVPGDVLLLGRGGTASPSYARLIEATGMRVDKCSI